MTQNSREPDLPQRTPTLNANELAEAYTANAARNLDLVEEFAAVDREIFERLNESNRVQ